MLRFARASDTPAPCMPVEDHMQRLYTTGMQAATCARMEPRPLLRLCYQHQGSLSCWCMRERTRGKTGVCA